MIIEDFDKFPAELRFQEKFINVQNIEHNKFIHYNHPVHGQLSLLQYVVCKCNVRIYIEIKFLRKIIKSMINKIICVQKEKFIRLKFPEKTINVVQPAYFDQQTKVVYLNCPITNELTGFVFIGKENDMCIFTSNKEIYDNANKVNF